MFNNYWKPLKGRDGSVWTHLVWHANQNANYLNGLIAPTVIPGESTGPTWEVVAEQDFETDDASNYEYNNNAIVSFTADGEGADGIGRAIKIVNEEVRENDWNSQFFLKFSPPMEEGERYILRMDVRSDDPASFSTQAHTVPYAYKHWDFFGSISSTPTWSEFVKEITVSADVATTGTIAFNRNHAITIISTILNWKNTMNQVEVVLQQCRICNDAYQSSGAEFLGSSGRN